MPICQSQNSAVITTTWPTRPAVLGDRRSARKPISRRSTAPARIGVATIRPRCWAVRSRSVAICTASGPSTYQTIKLRSKYRNAANKVGVWPDFQKLVFIENLIQQKRVPVGCGTPWSWTRRPQPIGEVVYLWYATLRDRVCWRFDAARGETSIDPPPQLG